MRWIPHVARVLTALVAIAMMAAAPATLAQTTALPQPNKIVVVFEENKAFGEVIGSAHAPYINELARKGALVTRAYAITHPSQPNYVALFSGSTAGVYLDWCATQVIKRENLGSLLVRKYGASGFATYSESLPNAGFTGCTAANGYARKHNPMVNWQGANFEGALSASANQPLEALPRNFSKLPKVSFIVPSNLNDMHDGASSRDAIAQGDAWLKKHLSAYVDWAMQHDSLLIVIWDEDDYQDANRVPLIFVGPMVKPGVRVDTRIDHYDVLRTLLDLTGLEATGEAKNRKPITSIWETRQ